MSIIKTKQKNNPAKLGVLFPALVIASLKRLVSKFSCLLLEEIVRNQGRSPGLGLGESQAQH